MIAGSFIARLLGASLLLAACANDSARDLHKASRGLGQSVSRGDASAVRASVVPSTRARLDTDAMLDDAAQASWKAGLRRPLAVEPDAVVFLRPEYPVRVVQTEAGWRFAEDPTDIYAQDTPRHALRALVWASRAERWDVVLRLAPKRYRMGLSEDDLRIAWTEGEYAQVLTGARDRVASHLGDPLVSDAHEAVLEVDSGHVVRLERERDQWVIVDFLPTGGDRGPATG